jgi:hypothetical protein
LGLLTYGFLQMQEIKSTVTTALNDKTVSDHILKMYRIELVLVPVILGVGTVAMTFFTWKLRAEFSWSIYKNISADLQMKRRYLTYQVRCWDSLFVSFWGGSRKLISLGLYCPLEIRFLLCVWKSTSDSPCCL